MFLRKSVFFGYAAFWIVSLSLFAGDGRAQAVDLAPVQKWIAAQQQLESLYGTFVQERKMRAVRNPLTREGEFWYQKPGRVRWQTGSSPIDRIAIKNDREVLVLEPKKKVMQRYSLQEVRENEKLKSLSFLEAGFPKSVDQFREGFKITDIEKDQGYYVVETKLRDTRASLALMKMVFYIYEGDYQLKAFRMFFRDKSVIYCRFTQVFPNKDFSSAVFTPDLSGYREDS